MTFVNYAVQRKEPVFEFSQFEPILSVGQMVVNNQGTIVSLNRRFISIWKLTECVVTARCERQVFQFIAEHLENPQSFLIDMRNVHEQMELEVKEQLELKNGRSFMHLTKPQWLEKTVIGRIHLFWPLL